MFKSDFLWGVAAASHQIEGATNIDGRGPSVWDTYCTRPNAVLDHADASVACDHYHRYKEDVALMKKLGVHSYRLSLSWSRMFPDGDVSRPNEKGIEFYDNLINELVGAGIRPLVTLFHWDYPQALEDKGGWRSPECSDYFEKYAEFVAKHFSDRVTDFITINEPQCYIVNGHIKGSQGPGYQLAPSDINNIIHNMHLCHGKAVRALRSCSVQPVKIAISLVGNVKVPYDQNSIEDLEMATKFMNSGHIDADAMWADPIFLGSFPDDIDSQKPGLKDLYTEEDMALISQPLDFYGVNLYSSQYVRSLGEGKWEFVDFPSDGERNNMGWPVIPEVMYYAIRHFYNKYHLPVIITENGFPATDIVDVDGEIHDGSRITFVKKYLLQVERAIDEGYDCAGYFYWSILDNFEWEYGYRPRFGIIRVDYGTQKRTLKDSAKWYSEVIRTNGKHIHD